MHIVWWITGYLLIFCYRIINNLITMPCGIKFLNLCKCGNVQDTNIDEIISIDYSHHTLNDVPNDIFQYERTLEVLHLNANMIKELPRELFYCQELKELNLCDNEIKVIPQAIGSLINLEKLDLCRNAVTTISDNIASCKLLKTIDLSCNALDKFPVCICCCTSVEELYLNSSYLEYLPSNIGKLINLKILEIRDNELIILPKSLPRLINLTRLDIGDNVFSELPEVVGDLKNLKELWIDENCIRRLSPNIGNLINLEHLDITKNCLTMMPTEIIKLVNLKELNLSSNELVCLPDGFGSLRNLVTFRCDENQLKELPDSICALENLEELMLSHNDIVRLPSSIGLLRKLRILTIDENLLHSLPKELCSCTSLSLLSVRGNKLTELPVDIGRLTNLTVMNLVNNFLTHLPMSVLNLSKLSALWISDNQSKALMQLQKEYGSDQSVHLTCFMLPQTSASAGKAGDFVKNSGSAMVKAKQTFYDELSVKKPPSNKRRHICFAAEPSTMIIEQPVRLVRSPTPYPKELRVLSKYVKNTTKTDGEFDEFDGKTIIKKSFDGKGKVEIREARVATSNIKDYPILPPKKSSLKQHDEPIIKYQRNIPKFNSNLADYVPAVEFLNFDKNKKTSNVFVRSRNTDNQGATGGITDDDDPNKIDYNLDNSTSQYSSFRSTKELSEINENLNRNSGNKFDDSSNNEGDRADYMEYIRKERNKSILEKNQSKKLNENNNSDTNTEENINELDRLLIDNNRQKQMITNCSVKTISVNKPSDIYYAPPLPLKKPRTPSSSPVTVTPTNQPPPYHIAKAYTKKSIHDLLVYDNYRQNNDINGKESGRRTPIQIYNTDDRIVSHIPESLEEIYGTLPFCNNNNNNNSGINNLSVPKNNDKGKIDDNNIKGSLHDGDNDNNEAVTSDYVFMGVGKTYKAQLELKKQKSHPYNTHNNNPDDYVLMGLNSRNYQNNDDSLNYYKPMNNNILSTVEEIDESDQQQEEEDRKSLERAAKRLAITKQMNVDNKLYLSGVELIGINDEPLKQTGYRHIKPSALILNAPKPRVIMKSTYNIKKQPQPWLFGRHNNPKVIQTTIRKIPGLGFTLIELPNQGIFIDKVLPDSPGAGILNSMDKLLDVDGVDFTKLTYQRANNYLKKHTGPVLNIMISRK